MTTATRDLHAFALASLFNMVTRMRIVTHVNVIPYKICNKLI